MTLLYLRKYQPSNQHKSPRSRCATTNCQVSAKTASSHTRLAGRCLSFGSSRTRSREPRISVRLDRRFGRRNLIGRLAPARLLISIVEDQERARFLAPRSIFGIPRARLMTAAMVCGRSSGDLASSDSKRGIERFRNVVTRCAERRNRPLAMAEQPLHEGLPAVRGLAGQEIVQRAAERVNVGTAVGQPRVIRLLGRHVVDRAHDRPADRQVELGPARADELIVAGSPAPARGREL